MQSPIQRSHAQLNLLEKRPTRPHWKSLPSEKKREVLRLLAELLLRHESGALDVDQEDEVRDDV